MEQGRVLGDALLIKSPRHEAKNKPVRFPHQAVYSARDKRAHCYVCTTVIGIRCGIPANSVQFFATRPGWRGTAVVCGIKINIKSHF